MVGSVQFVKLSSWQTARAFALALILSPGSTVFGQVNSWLKDSSGAWHDPEWSLGSLPGPGQSVFITNENWKAVAITPLTVQTNPGSLTVHSLTIGAPVDSRNVLLLDYAGFQVPFTTRFGRVETNAAITILSSALTLNGGGGEGMSIGGEVTQDASSRVTGQQMDLGYIGPGVYNLNSGFLGLNHVWIGGPFRGIFNQTGGSNAVGVIHLDPTGTYNLQGGDFNAEVYFEGYYPDDSLFRQTGGTVHHALTIHRGFYHLEGGINNAGVTVPIYAWGDGYGGVTQTGGTNFGPLHIGSNGTGTYTLSNGLSTGALRLGGSGSFVQWGGTQIIPGDLSIRGEWIGRNNWGLGSFLLRGGMVRCAGLYAEGNYTQSGGTNIVEGDISVQQSISPGVRFRMTGGLLRANSLTAFLGVSMSGGQLVLTNDLAVLTGGMSQPSWYGPELSLTGGELFVSNIIVRGNAVLAPGVVRQSGTFTLQNGRLTPASGSHQLGPLLVHSYGTQLESQITLPVNAPCILQFADSSAFPWTNNAMLIITNWAGSIAGGGTHQVRFGNDSAGLASQQLGQVLFHNPAGVAAGSYLARILSSGEIVPEALPPTGRVPPRLQLAQQPDRSMLITLAGQNGEDYGIEISTDLLGWQFWTNRVATNGSFSVLDSPAANQPRRFYRAVLR